MNRVLFLALSLGMVLSACAQATPTSDPAQIQASAVAAANTMVALTQAAIPTQTPIPPTALPSPTPLPSPTLLALPTLSLSPGPSSLPTTSSTTGGTGGNTGADPCQAPLVADPDGPSITVHIINSVRAPVILSLYLSKTTFGECGYRSFNLGALDSTTTTLPIGCYSGGAFVNDPKKPTKAFGSGCFRGGTAATVSVGTEVIRISQ